MLGLKPWHKRLLFAEVLATAVVLYGYYTLATASQARGFWEELATRVAGTALLSPGLWLLRPGPSDSLAPACLVTAAVYTVGTFGLLTLFTAVLKRIRLAAQSRHSTSLERDDTSRYLR